jgi:multiple sugar transport system substrate-binding protein
MADLEVSLMLHSPNTANEIQPVFDQFEAEHRVHIRAQVLDWETGWAEIVKYALYGNGPDVSEIGSTWTGNLVAMNALRPFSPADAVALGGAAAFVSAAWQSGMLLDNPQLWSIPWLSDTRLIFYRRDLLHAAGIDETTAFVDHAHLEDTLARLAAGGVARPWIVPTRRIPQLMHAIASWVWGAGGDFVSQDGRRILFNQPEAYAGMRAFFDLHRYLGAPPYDFGEAQYETLFRQGQAAVTVCGRWLPHRRELAPEVEANLGVARVPGIPFVGGSNLVIWQRTRQAGLALEFIRFLTGQRVQSSKHHLQGFLPVRSDVLYAPDYASTLPDQVAVESLRVGRPFPALPLWGLVEDKLTTAFADVWARLSANPDGDLDATITERLDPLAERLEMTLATGKRV